MRIYIVSGAIFLLGFGTINFVHAAQIYRVTCNSNPTFVLYNSGSTEQVAHFPVEAPAAARAVCNGKLGKLLKVTQRCIGDSKTRLYYQEQNPTDEKSSITRQIDHDWAGCKERYQYVKCEAKDDAYWFGRGSMFSIPFHILLPAFLAQPKVTAGRDAFLPLETPNIWCKYNSTADESQIHLYFKLQGANIVPTQEEKSCTIKQTATNPRSIVSSEYLKTSEGKALEENYYKRDDRNKTKIALVACAPNLADIDVSALTENCEAKPTAKQIKECKDKKDAISEQISGSSSRIAMDSKYAMLCGAPTKAAICASSEHKQELKTQCGMTNESLEAFCNQRAAPPSTPGAECTATGGSVKIDDATNKQFCDCHTTGKPLVQTSDGIGRCGQPTQDDSVTKQQCDVKKDHMWVPGTPNRCEKCSTGLKITDSAGVESCGCYTDRGYHPVTGGCQYQPAPVSGSCQALEGSTLRGGRCVCPDDQKPNDQQNRCVPKQEFTPAPPVPTPRPATCSGQQGTAGEGQIRVGGQCSDCQGNSVPNAAKDACVPGTASTKPKPGDACVTRDTRQPGITAQDGETCTPVVQCFNCTDPNKHCVEGRCVPKSQTCPQGQVLQNTQCVPQQQQCQQGQVLQNGQCVQDPRQQQCKQDEEMIQGRCFPKKPNPQQPKEQPKQQGPTPQQQQQQQQLQAMQECQTRQPQGAWQWNGFQCVPNQNYNPQGYGAQPSVAGGVVCNFFGSDAIEVPAGEQFSVTYDVTGAKREIKVDTSPKSTTKYDRQAPTTQQPAPSSTVLNQFGYPQTGATPVVQASQQGQATITAPKKKGKLKVSLIIDAVRQNSEACKPIQVTIVDAVPQSSYDSGNTSNYDSGSQYASNTQQQESGPTIETPSEIIAQNRKVVSSQPAQQAPEDDDAYAYLCKTLGIGCAKDTPQVDTGPSIRDLQVGNGTQQGTTREITIDPNAEDPADLPNIGELPGEDGRPTNGQQLATDFGVDGDNKTAYSTVLNYLGENGKYAEPIGPNSDTSGVLNSSDAEPAAQAEDRIGIFTRMWRWFLDLLGFGPEYVAA